MQQYISQHVRIGLEVYGLCWRLGAHLQSDASRILRHHVCMYHHAGRSQLQLQLHSHLQPLNTVAYTATTSFLHTAAR
jgi:hypothetical protein